MDFNNKILSIDHAIKLMYSNEENGLGMDDIEISKTFNIVNKFNQFFVENVELLAESMKITSQRAKEKLINQKAKYPKLGISGPIPTAFDIASVVKEWIMYVDDDKNDLHEISIDFTENGLGINILENEIEFLEIAEKKIFLQYWVDLGLGKESDIEIGKHVLQELIKINNYKKVKGDIIVYTGNPGIIEVQNEVGKNIREEIDKTIENLRDRINDFAQEKIKYIESYILKHKINPIAQKFQYQTR